MKLTTINMTSKYFIVQAPGVCHKSSLRHRNNYDRKKFYGTGPTSEIHSWPLTLLRTSVALKGRY
jgi:hypothetical protein